MAKFLSSMFVLLYLMGCASPKAVTKNYSVEKKDQFVAINLGVDAGRYIYSHEAHVVDHIYQSFEKSGLFQDVETAFPRWPVTVQIKYSWDQPKAGSGENFAKAMVSASTLLVVPAFVEENHTINARIIVGDKLVGKFEYTEKVSTAMSLFHDPVEDRKNGVNKMVQRLFEEIKVKKLIPTVADIVQKSQNKGQEMAL